MNRRPLRALVAPLLALLVILPLWAPPAGAGVLGTGSCIIGPRPAATLLIPYFEVDLDDPGHSTLFSVTNTGFQSGFFSNLPVPHIVRVVLWTDYGVPTLAFDVYLKFHDVQTFNVGDLLKGILPQTGQGQTLTGFAHCTAQNFPPGGGILAASVDRLRKRHTGKADPGTTKCAGFNHQDNVARGYITVDVTDQCQPLSASLGVGSPDQFQIGYLPYYPAGNPNVLTGDFYYLNTGDNLAEGNAAIPIIADSDRFKNDGTFTFYGRYDGNLGAVDHRAPLSSEYFTRYLSGGLFSGGTDLLVWREVPHTQVVECLSRPAWFPLPQTGISAVDENAQSKVIFPSGADSPFPLATQKVNVNDLDGFALPGAFGGLFLSLGKTAGHPRQALVLSTLSAHTHFSLGYQATPLNDLCGKTP